MPLVALGEELWSKVVFGMLNRFTPLAHLLGMLVETTLNFLQNMFILGLLNVFFLMVGLFLHSAAAIILVVPIVMPLINLVGIDPVHFGPVAELCRSFNRILCAKGERLGERNARQNLDIKQSVLR